VAEPVGEATANEIDIGESDYMLYYLYDQDTTEVARILATATANGSFAALTEYWNVPSLSTLQAATTLTLSAGDDGDSWPRGGLPFSWSFHVPRGSWSSSSTPTGTKLSGTDGNGNTAIFDPSSLTYSGGTWGGTMTWWYSVNTGWVTTRGAGSFSMKSGSVPSGTYSTIVNTPSQT
jgi:hypothetical protein